VSRTRLGGWTCPGGNRVEAFYTPTAGGPATVEMVWDSPPPLSATDEAFYVAVVRPAMARLVAEYTERTGRILVVTP
jgi:hypothetical protein